MDKKEPPETIQSYVQQIQNVAARLILEAPVLSGGDAAAACAALLVAAGTAAGVTQLPWDDVQMVLQHYYDQGVEERAAIDAVVTSPSDEDASPVPSKPGSVN